MKYKPRSADDLYEREQRRREADAEFRRLKERWPEARRSLSAEAIALAWFLLGDKTWTVTNS